MLKKSKSNSQYLAFGLLEVMISAMILSISLLGVAAMQSKVVNLTIESDRKETAYRMARQLINYTNSAANSASVTQQPLLNFITSIPASSSKSCLPSAPCTVGEYYVHFIADWQESVKSMLPYGGGCICVLANNNTTTPPSIELRVAIRWKKLSGTYEYAYLDNKLVSLVTSTAIKSCSSPVSSNITGCAF